MKKLLLLITICISSVSFGQIPSYVPANGLVGWWGFNGNASDESGNGNNGTVNGATLTTDRFGNASSAYDFDGVNDLISLSSNYDPAERTISAWFSLDLYSTLRQCILNNDYPQLINGHTIFTVIANDSLNLQSGNGGSITSPPVLNQWYFVCVTRNDSTRYFIDGQLVLTTANATLNSISAVSQNLRLGVSRDNNLYFNGKIDDVGTWNRSLTECEITELYTGQYCNVGISELNSNQPKELIKIVNLLGQEVEYTPNTILIYQYSNGTSEKVFTLED